MGILSIFFGIASLLGFVASVAVVSTTLHQISKIESADKLLTQLNDVLQTLSYSLVALIFCFLLATWTFSREINKLKRMLGDLPIENKMLTDDLNYFIFAFRSIADSNHTFLHYYRYLTIDFNSIIRDLSDLKKATPKKDREKLEKKFNKIISSFDRFLITILASISSTLDNITKDQCASCIKLVNDGKVKTFYRDPASNRYRERSDFEQSGKRFVYKVERNYAFGLIANPLNTNTSFICDDLSQNSDYFNFNPKWRTFYNATAVVPIQARISPKKKDNKYNLLGFLCVDNMKGGFEAREVKDFLSGFGDILYNLFLLYDKICFIAEEKGIDHDKIQEYKDWDGS